MKSALLILSFLLLGCGKVPSSLSGLTAADLSALASGNHVYEMRIQTPDTDFNYAPVMLGQDGNETSPGPQTVLLGETRTYTLTDKYADIQITGIGDAEHNGAFYATVIILKDGMQVLTWNVGIGVNQNSGTI